MSELRTIPLHRRGGVVRVLLIIVGFVAAAALAAVLWESLWTAPSGLAYEQRWFLSPSGPDVAVSGTAVYVVIAAAVSVVLGVCASLLPGHERAVLIGVVVGSVAAAWLMYAVGHALGPPDPHQVAAGQADLTPISGDLVLTTPGDSDNSFLSPALLAWPLGALAGVTAVYLLSSRPRRG